MNARNIAIKEVLKVGKLPVLSFEIELLKRRFEGHKETQVALGQKHGEAMSQASETWHDNAPAEAISMDSHALSLVAESILMKIGRAIVFEKPSVNDEVSLGHICTVEYAPGDNEVVLLVGGISNLPRYIMDLLPSGCVAATIESPLGAAILGAKNGDIVSFKIKGIETKVTIIAVETPQI